MNKIIRIPKLIVSIVCVLAVVAVIILAALGISNNASATMKRECGLFFLNSTRTELESEMRELRYKDKADLCIKAIEALKKGPEKNSLKPIIDAKTEFLSIDMADNENIVANFSKEFLTGERKRDILSVYAVAKTLCSIDGINSVKVVVENNEITTEEGSPIGYLTSEDINLASDINQAELHEVTLYFTKAGTNKLYPEKREIQITDQLPLAQHVVRELIRGPQNPQLMSCLSEDTGLIGANISANKCYVDFRDNFAGKNSGSPEHERLVIYSIVNSLSELDSVGQVQFLFEGKKTEKFGDITVEGLLETDYELIVQE